MRRVQVQVCSNLRTQALIRSRPVRSVYHTLSTGCQPHSPYLLERLPPRHGFILVPEQLLLDSLG